MANTFNDGTWVLDTADTSALLHGITGQVFIKKIRWQPNAADDTLVMKDGKGHTKVSETAIAPSPAGDINLDFAELNHGLGLEFHEGAVLHTLGGGTVYAYL